MPSLGDFRPGGGALPGRRQMLPMATARSRTWTSWRTAGPAQRNRRGGKRRDLQAGRTRRDRRRDRPAGGALAQELGDTVERSALIAGAYKRLLMLDGQSKKEAARILSGMGR